MRFWIKFFIFLTLVAIIYYIAYTYDKPLTCGLVNQYIPSFSQYLGCGIAVSLTPNSTITINNITGYKASVFQNLTYKYNNASYGVNYTKQYELAKKANPNITNVVPFTNFTTFSNSTRNQAYLNSAYTEFSGEGTSTNYINYSGVYTAIYVIVSDYYYTNGKITNYIPQLKGKTVLLEGSLPHSNDIIKIPYIVSQETIKGDKIYWNLTQDTGVSDTTAISVFNMTTDQNNHVFYKILGIYYNGTEILFPRGN